MDISTLPDAHLRIFDRPPVPEGVQDVYLIAICGTGMGSLAGLFKQAGFQVSGSDANVYPPMSTQLERQAILVHQGYDPAHLQPPPDLVIIGNACTPTHPEAAYAREQGLVQQSFPEALAHFFLSQRRSLVVAGTHGKTTTTGLLIQLFTSAGLDPGFLVGGVLQDQQTSYTFGAGPHFIVEGDEYDTAYFDKKPKFLHYCPTGAIVTSLELDHTDIYTDYDMYRGAFESFVALLPQEGTLVLCHDHASVAALAAHSQANIIYYGLGAPPEPGVGSYVTGNRTGETADGQRFELLKDGVSQGELFLPLHGDHNLSNTLGACALAMAEGIGMDQIRTALAAYKGMKRRQEVRGNVNGIVVLDDFAHHPTAVKETIRAVHRAYPERRLVAVFEPRSNSSRRKDFQPVYVEAFDKAGVVVLSSPPFRHNDDPANFMDIQELVTAVCDRGIPAHSFEHFDALLDHLTDTCQPGDVVLIMSNGGFNGIHDKLLGRLASRS